MVVAADDYHLEEGGPSYRFALLCFFVLCSVLGVPLSWHKTSGDDTVADAQGRTRATGWPRERSEPPQSPGQRSPAARAAQTLLKAAAMALSTGARAGFLESIMRVLRGEVKRLKDPDLESKPRGTNNRPRLQSGGP